VKTAADAKKAKESEDKFWEEAGDGKRGPAKAQAKKEEQVCSPFMSDVSLMTKRYHAVLARVFKKAEEDNSGMECGWERRQVASHSDTAMESVLGGSEVLWMVG
jgi:hypothetical protein